LQKAAIAKYMEFSSIITPITEKENHSERNISSDLFLQAHSGLDRFLIYFPWDHEGARIIILDAAKRE